MVSTGVLPVLITTYLASAVEATEMVTIVVGVGATRGWRSTLIGAAAGFGVLGVIVLILGAALSQIPIGPLRLIVGALLLIFGLQWFRKGIRRVAARGFAGMPGSDPHGDEAEQWRGEGIDWTAFVLSFKGVLLEGLEVAFIVVSFGAGANNYGAAIVGGAAAVVMFLAIGFSLHRSVRRIPRSVLQLIVGILLTTFGTFWSAEGLGVEWPASDGTIVVLLLINVVTALTYISLERRQAFGMRAAA
jgi:uncharacterized membrane protein